MTIHGEYGSQARLGSPEAWCCLMVPFFIQPTIFGRHAVDIEFLGGYCSLTYWNRATSRGALFLLPPAPGELDHFPRRNMGISISVWILWKGIAAVLFLTFDPTGWHIFFVCSGKFCHLDLAQSQLSREPLPVFLPVNSSFDWTSLIQDISLLCPCYPNVIPCYPRGPGFWCGRWERVLPWWWEPSTPIRSRVKRQSHFWGE